MDAFDGKERGRRHHESKRRGKKVQGRAPGSIGPKYSYNGLSLSKSRPTPNLRRIADKAENVELSRRVATDFDVVHGGNARKSMAPQLTTQGRDIALTGASNGPLVIHPHDAAVEVQSAPGTGGGAGETGDRAMLAEQLKKGAARGRVKRHPRPKNQWRVAALPRIYSGLYISDRLFAERGDLEARGIRHVVKLTAGKRTSACAHGDLWITHIEIPDSFVPFPTFHNAAHTVACAIAHASERDEAILVHCDAGVNRSSALIAAAALIRSRSSNDAFTSTDERLEYIQDAKHAVARENDGFWDTLSGRTGRHWRAMLRRLHSEP